jgi:hypothetical protein
VPGRRLPARPSLQARKQHSRKNLQRGMISARGRDHRGRGRTGTWLAPRLGRTYLLRFCGPRVVDLTPRCLGFASFCGYLSAPRSPFFSRLARRAQPAGVRAASPSLRAGSGRMGNPLDLRSAEYAPERSRLVPTLRVGMPAPTLRVANWAEPTGAWPRSL